MDEINAGSPPDSKKKRPLPPLALLGRISWKQAFTALRYRNYRLYFWGQMVSLFGTWMQITAQGFLVYELTRSPAYLGVVGFAHGIPTWLFMLYGGVMADRLPRKKLMLLTQSSMTVLALLMAALTLSGLIRPWHVVLLAFGFGLANAFDAPARHAFVAELVPREDLTNAIALNSTMFNTSAVAGPAVAGIIYAALGPSWCFFINGASFFAVIAALLAIRVKASAGPGNRNSAWRDIREGVGYVLAQRLILTLVGVVAMTSLFGAAFSTLIPAWAVKVLKGDAATNGALYAARGAGALMAALLIASLGRFRFKGRLLSFGSLLLPMLLLVFAFIRKLPPALFFLVGVGWATMIVFNLANALIQIHVAERLRGRVMAIYSLTFFGLMPVGALWVGFVAERFGEPTAVIINSLVLLIFFGLVRVLVPGLRKQE